ncbi:M20/M25/M40 family metallo-hydrolase [Marivirga salinae]|uniref:M20/M25/M40 family metallo-hydrolase n=1 Tax=Marivirga salinarum TaxID=3059078 RepID=A0AA49JBK3_9BACT|nr:M20/M25/M40 family metallo-hydrolase [Marivirga sp. BDSF4-3]WKK76141.2 M20/M25/M40 family metallo-hydrolase [Marivirga sp. BDSF4-3]
MRYLFILFFLSNISIGSSQSDLAREHLSILTSDSLGGRGFTQNGQEKASNYIIKKLQEYDLKAGGDNNFRQELTYPVNTFPGSAQFSVENQNAIKIYGAGKDFLFHSASASIDIKGQIEEISIGFKFSRKAKNKIFYIEKTANNAKEIEDITQSFLFDLKASGNLLIIQDSAKWSWFPSSKQSNNSVLYVKDHLKSGAEIRATNEAKFVSNFNSSNVIGKIEGERSDSVILLSAHYDHIGQMGSAIFRGANDNASGVAMLLALAKYYGENQPKLDTYFLFTTAEEIGLLGSYYFIENPPFDLRKIKMLVNLDMVGTGEEGITVVNSKKHNRYFELLQKLNNDRITKIKARGEACNSDHCLFDQIGIPAVFIYTLGGKQAYHDVYDNGEDLSLEAFDELHDLIIESLNKY